MSKQMATATTGVAPDWRGISLNDALRVSQGDKLMLGSCNACTKGQYVLDNESKPTVTNVDLRGLSFRLCERCRQQLKAML